MATAGMTRIRTMRIIRMIENNDQNDQNNNRQKEQKEQERKEQEKQWQEISEKMRTNDGEPALKTRLRMAGDLYDYIQNSHKGTV